jgi:AcrR family transcriptional regulator
MQDSSTRISDVVVKAAALIRDQGFEATTVNDICRVTGLTKGGLYHYIKSKRELLYKIMKSGMEHLEAEVVEGARNINDPEEQLREVIRLHVQNIYRDKGTIGILTNEDEALEPKHREEILRRKRDYFNFVRGAVERLHARGDLEDVDLNVATFNILAQILFFPRWYRPDGPLSPNDVAEQIADTAIRGLKKPDAVPAMHA